MTGINPTKETSELETATIAVLAVAAGEFLGYGADDLQSIHDSIISSKDSSELPENLTELMNVSKTFYFTCFLTPSTENAELADRPELYEALQHVARVIQPPVSEPSP